MMRKPKRRRSCRLELSDSPHMPRLLSSTCCLREPIYFPRRMWATCDIWQRSIRGFIQLLHTQIHIKIQRLEYRLVNSPQSFDRLNRRTSSFSALRCDDSWQSWYNPLSLTYCLFWCQVKCKEENKCSQNCWPPAAHSITLMHISTATLCDHAFLYSIPFNTHFFLTIEIRDFKYAHSDLKVQCLAKFFYPSNVCILVFIFCNIKTHDILDLGFMW